MTEMLKLTFGDYHLIWLELLVNHENNYLKIIENTASLEQTAPKICFWQWSTMTTTKPFLGPQTKRNLRSENKFYFRKN